MNRQSQQNPRGTGKGRRRGIFRRRQITPPATSPEMTSAGLGMLSVVSMIAVYLERDPHWRIGAMISGGLSAATAMLVLTFRGHEWVQWPIRAALLSNFVTGGRLHMRYSRKKS